ncbi:MAG: hypothetical protein IPG35_00175 [Flavobacteriales bacterium]|nr:hypothetical protein [Flavobacteriales bacterium]MBK8950181.1 hypothetical protein [Flavobacteriales bacterium]
MNGERVHDHALDTHTKITAESHAHRPALVLLRIPVMPRDEPSDGGR